MQSQVMEITPDLAAAWLLAAGERNGNGIADQRENRRLRPRNLERLKRERLAGRWRVTNDAVAFSGVRPGVGLLNGQHRLLVAVHTGMSIQVLVVWGLDPDSFECMDVGAPRKASDALSIDGEKNCVQLSSALVWILRFMASSLYSVTHYSITEIRGALEKHPNIRTSIDLLRRLRSQVGAGRVINPSLGAALHYLFAQLDKDLADAFMSDLFVGANLKREDPVFLLRNRLLADLGSKAKLPDKEVAALAIKAWNARRRGLAVQNLRWRSTGKAPESFPAID